MLPKVSIIILNWNGKEDTCECLESLKYITYPHYTILLVDNGSTDRSVEFIKEKYPKVEIIENEKNLGFAEGNNVGVREVIKKDIDYILLLNNDTIVDPNFLSELIAVAESSEDIGVTGPTVYFYDEPNRVQFAGAKISIRKGRIRINGVNEIDFGQFNGTLHVDYVCGCALLGKRQIFEKVGYLNKHYFAYWEETEWCARVREAGYKIVYAPKSKIWHKGGATSGKIKGFQIYHMTRNMFWFMKKHATREQYVFFLLYFFGFRFWFSCIAELIYYKNIKGIYFFIKGVIDGMVSFH